MHEEKFSNEIMACAAIVVGEGAYHVVVKPDGGDGSDMTVYGEGNKPGRLRATYAMLIAYMNAGGGTEFDDAMEQLRWLHKLGEEECDTRIIKSIKLKGEEV